MTGVAAIVNLAVAAGSAPRRGYLKATVTRDELGVGRRAEL
jgi:hypothetical protein